MSSTSKVKPTDAAIKKYHDALAAYAEHEASHEGATETAFSNLLASTAHRHGWTLIPKKKKSVAKKVYVYPDGTLQDVFKLARGYWEAKDTDDDLDAEIQKKIAKKYPLSNTIFEDTQRATRIHKTEISGYHTEFVSLPNKYWLRPLPAIRWQKDLS